MPGVQGQSKTLTGHGRGRRVQGVWLLRNGLQAQRQIHAKRGGQRGISEERERYEKRFIVCRYQREEHASQARETGRQVAMLAKRIIPCLDVKGGRVVKGINFLELRDAGDPVEHARVYDEQGADELVFLDITASHEQRGTMLDVVRRTAECCFMPLTVGGGIRSVDDMRALLNAGADKVSINTIAVTEPQVITEGARRFGSQCIVVAIDARHCQRGTRVNIAEAHALRLAWDIRAVALDAASEWEVYVHGGRTPTGIDAIKWARHVEALGAGELLVTSMDCDGTKAGYDIPQLAAVSAAVHVPVIASGGAGTLGHFRDALTVGGADAALAASLFHFRELTIAQVKDYLAQQGIPVRPLVSA